MKALNIRQVRSALCRLDELLDSEGEILITRHGKAVARLLPVRAKRELPSNADLRSKLPRLGVGSETVIREERDER